MSENTGHTPEASTIDEDGFFEKYKPIQNPFTKEGSFNNCMLETYGQEFDLVKQAKENTVWTIVDDGENMAIAAGFHHVNRMGYILTEVPWVTGNEDVVLENLTEEEPDEDETEEDENSAQV